MTDTRATDGHEGHAHHHDHGAHVGITITSISACQMPER